MGPGWFGGKAGVRDGWNAITLQKTWVGKGPLAFLRLWQLPVATEMVSVI